MLNKKLKWMLWGSALLCCGCVQDEYDLNKDIVLDVTISGNKITLPTSNFKPIVLDSLIDVNDIEIMEKMNGEYCLQKKDVIDPIDIEIDPIKLNIDPVTHNTTFQFDDVTIEEAVLHEVVQEQEMGIEDVTIEDLNEKLPTLTTNETFDLTVPEMEQQLELLKQQGGNAVATLPLDYTVSTGAQNIAFALDYTLPEEIHEITEIKLNNLIQFKVTNPDILDDVQKTISFKTTFPEGFVLALDNNAPNADKYALSADKRTVSINDLTTEGEAIYVQFYIDNMGELREKQSNGVISLDENITYEVDYSVDGDVTLNAQTELDDFNFQVATNHKVTFEDAKGSTNEITIDFEKMDFDFSAHFNNLHHIKEVEYIEFDATNSKIFFTTDLGDGGFDPFTLKEGCELKLQFPKNFTLDQSESHYPNGVTYNAEEHAFYINDLNSLHHYEWALALQRIDVDTKVKDEACDLNAIASLSVKSDDGTLKLAEAEFETLNAMLKKLHSKDVTFTMKETHLHIDDAVVQTDVIHEAIEEHSTLSINEKIDDNVSRINTVEFAKEVPITIDVKLNGVEEINTVVHLTLDVVLPPYLKVAENPSENRIEVNGDTLSIEADYSPINDKNGIQLHLLADKIDFSGEEYPNGIELEKTGNTYYLKLDTDIPIEGEAYIDETELHSEVLGKDVTINVDFNIAEIEVGKFSGIYCGTIDDIHETIDLDLGEDLDFLKDKGNYVDFADPQLMFTIDNPVGIPVNLALALSGKDDNGKEIDGSRVETNILLAPAEVINGEVTTSEQKFLLTKVPTQLEGYTNVVVDNLSDLLKTIPNTIDIDLVPTIDESVTHYVDLSKELVFHPEYNVVVPLEFDTVHIEYIESVDDLNKDLADPMQHFSNVEIDATLDVLNTVPVELILTAQPLDIYGNVIEGIEVEDVKIAAGNGESITKADGSSKVQKDLKLKIKSRGKQLEKLDKINIVIKGDTNQTVGGKPLKPEQGVHITNVRIVVTSDIDTNLEEI